MCSWWFNLVLKRLCSVREQVMDLCNLGFLGHTLPGKIRVTPCTLSGPAPSRHCRISPAVCGRARGCVLSYMVLSITKWPLHSASLLYGSLWWHLCWDLTYPFPLRTLIPVSCYSCASKPWTVSPPAVAVGTHFSLSLSLSHPLNWCLSPIPLLPKLGQCGKEATYLFWAPNHLYPIQKAP